MTQHDFEADVTSWIDSLDPETRDGSPLAIYWVTMMTDAVGRMAHAQIFGKPDEYDAVLVRIGAYARLAARSRQQNYFFNPPLEIPHEVIKEVTG